MSSTSIWRDLYPFKSHFLKLDGYTYHYLDEADFANHDDSEALLLVHGNPTWSFYWRELVKAFRGEFRVVVPDHMGCGLSDKPPDYPYCLQRHIENLCQLIESLDLRNVTLLAHDWGGAIGLGAAEAMPDRFARFVLFNSAAFRSDRMPLRIRICRTPLLGRLAVQGLNSFARAALRMATHKPERMTPEVRAGYLAPYNSWNHRKAIHRFVMDIPMKSSHPSYASLLRIEKGLEKFRSRPMMFIWGMQDWCFTPHFLDRFLEFFPEAEVHRLAEAGHYVVEDAHEEIVPLVEQFLKTHPLAKVKTT